MSASLPAGVPGLVGVVLAAADVPPPWVGLAAIVAMFLLPWLEARGLLDGPHLVRRRPHREVCGDCGAPWTPDHQCAGWLEAAVREPVVPLQPPPAPPTLRAELVRSDQPPTLPPRRRRS
jgi:hypothetical protein